MKQEIYYTATELYGGAPEWDAVTVVEPEIAPYDDTDIDRWNSAPAEFAPMHCADCGGAKFALCDDWACSCTAPPAAPDTTATTAAPDQRGAELAPLSPLDALRVALQRGVFACETKALLLASLHAADEAELMRAEQLAAARESVAINLEMRKIEAEVFDLPF